MNDHLNVNFTILSNDIINSARGFNRGFVVNGEGLNGFNRLLFGKRPQKKICEIS